jgi:hypothetical protein
MHSSCLYKAEKLGDAIFYLMYFHGSSEVALQ